MGHEKGSGRTPELAKYVDKRRSNSKFSVSSSLEDYCIHKFSTWGSAVAFLEITVDHAYQDAQYREFKENGRSLRLKQMEIERKEIVGSISSIRTYKGDIYIFIDGIGYWTRLL